MPRPLKPKAPKPRRRTLALHGYRPPKGVKSWYRGSSGWHIIFTDETRRPKSKWVALDTHADPIAAARFVERAQAYDLGQLDPWGAAFRPVTVAEAADAFIAADPRLRESTRGERRQTLDHFIATLPGGGELALSAVTAADVRSFVYRGAVRATKGPDGRAAAPAPTGRPLSSSTRAGYYARLRTFFRWAVRGGLLRDDPTSPDRAGSDALERPRVERKVPAHLTPADVDRIVAACEAGDSESSPAPPWFVPVVLLAVNTGMRLGEIVALRWADVEWGAPAPHPAAGSPRPGRIYVRNYRRADGTERRTKTGGERVVPMTSECRTVLENLRARRVTGGSAEDAETVFLGTYGGPLSPGQVSATFRRYRRRAKLPEAVHFHSLRHTAASWMVSRSVPLRLVQDVLGHSSIRSTEIYAHLLPGATETVIEALDGVRGAGPRQPVAAVPPLPVSLDDLSEADRARLASEMLERFGLSRVFPGALGNTSPVAAFGSSNPAATEK